MINTNLANFFKTFLAQICKGALVLLIRKIILVARLVPACLVVLLIRLIKPWLLVRWGVLHSTRIGHFAGNTEQYLCERDVNINVPYQRYFDIFFMDPLICNKQLEKMWKRILRIWPFFSFMHSVKFINNLFPGGKIHEIGDNSKSNRDVHNLLDKLPSHLAFTAEEETKGKEGLRSMGIPYGAQFVCMIVRDAAYLNFHQERDWSYHNYRDSDISNYVLASETLASRGYYVIRMGVKVNDAMKTNNSKVIDYATNGMRSDFMDIYLGAKCAFCISVGTGFDAIPSLFRRPIALVNYVPAAYFPTYSKMYLGIFKHYLDEKTNQKMSLTEIFTSDIGFITSTAEYTSKEVKLLENTPEEIRDLAIEMAERLNGTWLADPEDDSLQQRFWKIFPTDALDVLDGLPLHGEIRARFGATFLRNNRGWLE